MRHRRAAGGAAEGAGGRRVRRAELVGRTRQALRLHTLDSPLSFNFQLKQRWHNRAARCALQEGDPPAKFGPFANKGAPPFIKRECRYLGLAAAAPLASE